MRTTCPRLLPERARPGVEPETFGVEVPRPNHYATWPHMLKTVHFGAIVTREHQKGWKSNSWVSVAERPLAETGGECRFAVTGAIPYCS